jgi:hypothetical protein
MGILVPKIQIVVIIPNLSANQNQVNAINCQLDDFFAVLAGKGLYE